MAQDYGSRARMISCSVPVRKKTHSRRKIQAATIIMDKTAKAKSKPNALYAPILTKFRQAAECTRDFEKTGQMAR